MFLTKDITMIQDVLTSQKKDGKPVIREEKKNIASCFDDSNAASIQKAVNVSVGSGFIWNDEDVRNARFDDVKVYDGTLTAEEIMSAYQN